MTEIFTGKTIEEAKAEAVKFFGADESKITFEILEEPKKMLLFTKGEAKIQARFEPERCDVAADYIRGILKGMGVEAELNVTPSEDGCLIEIVGDTSGTVIGRRGETLDAIQYLATMVCNRSDKEYYRVSVDSCGYREKRKATLEELAVKISKTVSGTETNPTEFLIVALSWSSNELRTRTNGNYPLLISAVTGSALCVLGGVHTKSMHKFLR